MVKVYIKLLIITVFVFILFNFCTNLTRENINDPGSPYYKSIPSAKFIVNGGADYSLEDTITIKFKNKDITHYKFSEDKEFTGQDWQVYNKGIEYKFDSEGVKTLYGRTKNKHKLTSDIFEKEFHYLKRAILSYNVTGVKSLQVEWPALSNKTTSQVFWSNNKSNVKENSSSVLTDGINTFDLAVEPYTTYYFKVEQKGNYGNLDSREEEYFFSTWPEPMVINKLEFDEVNFFILFPLEWTDLNGEEGYVVYWWSDSEAEYANSITLSENITEYIFDSGQTNITEPYFFTVSPIIDGIKTYYNAIRSVKKYCQYPFLFSELGASSAWTNCIDPDFVDNNNGTILDINNQLVWTKCSLDNNGEPLDSNDCQSPSVDNSHSWYDAVSYCDLLNYSEFGSYSNWKLPDFEQLLSIKTSDNPYIDLNFFPSTIANYYWSSTDGYITSMALKVSFTEPTSGMITNRGFSENKLSGNYVRCVNELF
jgi:hypothetical protein